MFLRVGAFYAFLTVLWLVSFGVQSNVKANPILDKDDVEKLFQGKLNSYRDMIQQGDIEGLKQAVRNFTHDETIVLFEFSLKTPEISNLPAQKAYFNRDPFVKLMENSKFLHRESFEIDYTLDKFQPQYGGGSAIIHDSGTASGKMMEAFSGDEYTFEATQKCRNTISAHAETMFKIDSIYCRMEIAYEPVLKEVITVSGEDPVKELEKPVIADIISEIEEKQQSQQP